MVVGSPTPRKIRAGVISAPPPMPVRPTTTPTKKPAARIEKKEPVIRSPMVSSGWSSTNLAKTTEPTAYGELRDFASSPVRELGQHLVAALLDRPPGRVDPQSGVV